MNIDTKIPGLHIEFKKVGSSTYASLIHISSGKYAYRWNRAPLRLGKRKFAALIDASGIGEFDWTVEADKIPASKEFAYWFQDCMNTVTGVYG